MGLGLTSGSSISSLLCCIASFRCASLRYPHSSALFAARLGRLSSSHFFFHLNKKIGVFFTAVQQRLSGRSNETAGRANATASLFSLLKVHWTFIPSGIVRSSRQASASIRYRSARSLPVTLVVIWSAQPRSFLPLFLVRLVLSFLR